MRIALLSDIHSNEDALDETLLDIERKRYSVDEIWCLGDIIGYGPRPLACLKKVRSVCAHVLQGNHERFAVMKAMEPRYNLELAGFKGPGAVAGLHWALRQLYGDATPVQKDKKECDRYTRELLARVRADDFEERVLSEASKEFSVGVPFFKRVSGGDAMVRALLGNRETRELYRKFTEQLENVEQGNELVEYMADLPTEKIVDVGGVKIHITHDNFISPGDCKYTLDEERDGKHLDGNISLKETFDEWEARCERDSEYAGVRIRAAAHSHRQLMRGHEGRWYVNCGSAGGLDREKDSSPMARYVIINTEAARFPVYTHAVEFDVDAVGAEMEAAGLPNKFKSSYGGLD